MIFSTDPAVWLKDFFIDAGQSYSLSSFLSTVALVIIVALLSWLSNFLAKTIILKIVTRIVKNTKSRWDDVFLEKKVFTRLSHLAPALVIWFMAGWALKEYPLWLVAVHKMTYLYMVVIGIFVINSFIEAWHQIYLTLPISQHRHIKGYVQLVKIFVVLVAILIIISVVFNKRMSNILTGIGVIASVLILVFRDTLLGLVASIQLSSDKLLKVGEWITIPKRDVDGVVTDITLNTVKVQNFDKTIITVPTYAMVQESFQNWSGMKESGIRQIKRPIFIDMKSIKFLDEDLKSRLSRISVLKEYIGSLEKGNENDKNTREGENDPFFNYDRITNLGIFRYYAEKYLAGHPKISNESALVVRHRPVLDNGLPLEINVFSNDNDFISYEMVQNEIFEHFLAILKEFDLNVFQQPTGEDMRESLKNKVTG